MIGLRAKGQTLPATIYIGKDGVTQNVISEISNQLKKHKLVKVRLLPALNRDRKVVGAELASLSASVLVEVRGRTVLLAKDEQ